MNGWPSCAGEKKPCRRRRLAGILPGCWHRFLDTQMRKRTVFWIFLGVVSAEVILYLSAWWIIDGFSGPSAEHLLNIIYLVGGTTAAFIATWRAWVADKQTKINEQGQITDRFTHAVEQLGDKNIYIRIGAIHALERIGRDSEDDLLAVLRLLASFVRDKSPVKQVYGRPIPTGPASLEARESMKVIGRLSIICKELLRTEKGISLSDAYLASLSLKGYFPSFDFSQSNFYCGCFQDSELEKANFSFSKLLICRFKSCNLRHAEFICANLYDATFDCVDMDGAKLANADCNKTDFSGARNITQEMLSHIIYDAKTPPVLPPYLSPDDLPKPGRKNLLEGLK